MHNVTYQYGQPKNNNKRRNIVIAVVIILIISICFGIWMIWFYENEQPNQQAQVVTESQKENEVTNEPQLAPLPNLQKTIDSWTASHKGTYSVYITDSEGEVLASISEDKEHFTASIYKLYVAYVGYQKIDDGTYKADEPYLSAKTRAQCLDAMIRDSDSPCGEKMWSELGKQELTNKMKELELTNTSLVNLNSSAKDAAIILQKIQSGEGLSEKSQVAFLDSMKTQDSKYRRGLPSGFSQLAVFNKVGWNLSKEWHDTAIVQLPDGRAVIISVFTENAGYSDVAGLGKQIEQQLIANL